MRHFLLLALFFGLSSFCLQAQLPKFSITLTNDSLLTNKNIKKGEIVFVFLDKNCPYSNLYSNRIESLISMFPKVQFIIVGNDPREGENVIYAEDKKHELKKSFLVKKAPAVYYYEKLRFKYQLIYSGAIDDNPQLAKDVRNSYLMDALISPKIETKKTRPVGCHFN